MASYGGHRRVEAAFVGTVFERGAPCGSGRRPGRVVRDGQSRSKMGDCVAIALAVASKPHAPTIGLLCGLMITAMTVQAAMNELTSEMAAAGWQSLFDGESLAGWRNYQAAPGTPVRGWSVVDGTLARTSAGGDIVSEQQFTNFELALEWRVREGGNSGIFIRATEDEPLIYESAPEMQVLDDARHPDGADPLTSAGSNYGLNPAPRGVVKPAGEWNAVRIRVEGDRVTHWLNDERIVDYDLGSEDWKARVADSKFAAWPNYGTAPRGHIGLQDHGDPVAFRNIRILPLPDAP